MDFSGDQSSLLKNQNLEFERNKERFQFLKWGSDAFDGLEIVPPGSGIVHQVNLEYLARVVFNKEPFQANTVNILYMINSIPSSCSLKRRKENVLFPDSLVGTDSHTTMINGLGVLGWGVGGIEAEAVMLAQPISMVLPEVVGYKITGEIPSLATSTDVVLTITKHLRNVCEISLVAFSKRPLGGVRCSKTSKDQLVSLVNLLNFMVQVLLCFQSPIVPQSLTCAQNMVLLLDSSPSMKLPLDT